MLAVIGGTGLYQLDGMQVERHLDEDTPFGRPSGRIARGRLGGRELLFLARHGSGHRLLPHEVNYRANVYALKRAGATQILGFSAVGSLVQEVAPGDLAMPAQYFDWTRGPRARSFFGDGVAAQQGGVVDAHDDLDVVPTWRFDRQRNHVVWVPRGRPRPNHRSLGRSRGGRSCW